MTENTEETIQPISDTKAVTTKRPASYPVKTLQECIQFCEKIYKELGDSNYHSAQDIGDIHHLAIASIKQVLSTCQQYLLLELKHGTGYKTTPTLVTILHPENEDERVSVALACLNNPDLYRELINDYSTKPLPSEIGLANLLTRRGYNLQVAKKIVSVFLDNLKQYNLLTPRNTITLNGKVIASLTKKEADIKEDQDSEGVVEHSKNNYSPPTGGDFVEIPIPLKSDPTKLAKLILPKSFTSEDLTRIAKFVAALE